MKAMLLKLADLLALLWQLLPGRARRMLLKGLFVVESRGDAGKGLKQLFAVADDLEHVTNERALVYGKGIHPKHRLMRYHDFFSERINDGEGVLDIGCGYGAVARSVAKAHPTARVIGVDYDAGRLAQARANPETPANLSFVSMDATKEVPPGQWDVVVLSNVLEHIVDRPDFLKALAATTGAGRFLIRVPLFERDWKMPMRREVGANYYSDPDHKIEHTRAEFAADIAAAGMELVEFNTIWGEIWSVARPKGN